MRGTLKFLVALVVSLVAMLVFRALFFTVYSVGGPGLEPAFETGDRVLVNRWSYGLRTGGEGLFSYDRLCRQSVEKGDYVAFDDSLGRVFIGRCTALPGDTAATADGHRLLLPSRENCAPADYYYLQPGGVVEEQRIIGRAVTTLFNPETLQFP